jgi:TolA-binding protein
MTHRTHLPIVVLAACVMTTPVSAQNRVDQQVFLELRTLQSQVQRLQLAVNAVTEQLKGTDARVDAQAGTVLKGFADQKGLIDAIAAAQRALGERESESAVRVLQLNQEMKAIREGLTLQQTLLNEILTLLQPAAPPGVIDPAAPPPTTPPGRGAAIPPSPGAYYDAAFGFYYDGQFDSAIKALEDAIKRFPEFPRAASAQLTIGDSYDALGGRNKEALDAYGLVIQNYKDPDVVPDAYLKQGLVYEKMGQKDAAIKRLQELRKLFPNSTAADLALPALKRLGVIK